MVQGVGRKNSGGTAAPLLPAPMILLQFLDKMRVSRNSVIRMRCGSPGSAIWQRY